jgi:hypothetical protein
MPEEQKFTLYSRKYPKFSNIMKPKKTHKGIVLNMKGLLIEKFKGMSAEPTVCNILIKKRVPYNSAKTIVKKAKRRY